VRPAQRFLAIGLLIGLVEVVIGLPLIGTVLGWYFLVLGAVTAAIAVAAHGLLEPPPRDDEGGDDGGGGPPEGDPPWWPEFESAFRAYLRDRTRTPA